MPHLNEVYQKKQMTKKGQIMRIIESNKQKHLDLIRGLKKTVGLLSFILIMLMAI